MYKGNDTIMASIVKRGKSYSVVHSIEVDGQKKQKWETYHTFKEASQRKEFLEIYKQQHKVRESGVVGIVEQLMKEYVRLYGVHRWSLSTYQSNIGLIDHYILPFMGTIRLSELSPRVIAELYRRLLLQPKTDFTYQKAHGRTVSACTLKSIHKLLHSAFEQAVLWEYVSKNPFQKAALPQVHPHPCKFLEPEEIKAFLKGCNDATLALAVHLAFAASLRKGELLALTWADIDFENQAVRINKTLSRVSRDAIDALDGKDILFYFPPVWQEHQTRLILKHPKTKSSDRTVYLPSSVVKLLAEYRKSKLISKYPIRSGEYDPELIFCYPDGRPIQESTISKRFHSQLSRLSLSKVSFHSLRHSSITYKLILSCGNIKAVQGDSGHSQAEMVTDLYGHILGKSRRETAARFECDFYLRQQKFEGI